MSTLNGKGEEKISSPFISSVPFSRPELAQVRHIIYRFLASAFLYPNPNRMTKLQETARLLLDDDLWPHFPFHESWLNLLHYLADVDKGQQDLIEGEFTRLFTVNPRAIPQESFYTDVEGLARGMIVAYLEQEYRDAGLETSANIAEEPDHVSVELEFMAFLIDKEIQSLETGQEETASEIINQQQEFVRKHLSRWFPKFAKRVKDAHAANLYELLIEAAFLFLRHELEMLGLRR